MIAKLGRSETYADDVSVPPSGDKSAPGRHRPVHRSRTKTCTIYGEEVKFGGGKVIRDGMGQSQVTSGRRGR